MDATQLYLPVVHRGDKRRHVKNLGWLLRHWDEVRHFTIRTKIDGRPVPGTLFIAWLYSGPSDAYSCGWAGDLDHVLQWLRRRRVFHGLSAYIDPEQNASKSATCGGRKVVL